MKINKKFFLIAIFLVFAISFLMRLSPFWHGDFLFFQDQSRDLLLVKQIIEEGKPILIGSRTGVGGLFHGPVWVYSLIPSFVLTAGDPYWTFMTVDILYSLLIVIAGFIVGWKLYSKWVALIFAYFLSISQPLIASLYYMTDAHVTPLPFLGYLYFLIRYFRGNQKALILAVFFAGLCFQFEPAFAIVLLPILVLFILYTRNISIRTILLSIFAFVLSVFNFILFDVRHNFLMTASFSRLINGGEGTISGYENYQRIDFRIFERISGALGSYSSPLYSKDNLTIGLLVLLITISLFLFTKNYFKKRKLNIEDREYLFLFAFPFIAYLPYVLYKNPLWSHYVLPIIVAVSLFLSLTIWRIRNNLFGLLVSIVLIVSSLVPFTNSISSTYLSQSKKYVSSSDSSYKNQVDVVLSIIDQSKNKPFNYLVYTPATFTYNMDYLFSWKKLSGNKKITPCSKDGLTFLIFYPHLKGDNGAYAFWKKNVVRIDSPVIASNFFPGGIWVEEVNNLNDNKPIDPNYCQNLIFR